VCSWKQASGDEVLYVRPDAVFDKSKPISGGAMEAKGQPRVIRLQASHNCMHWPDDCEQVHRHVYVYMQP
jgi:hypothetical protein